MSRNPGTLVYDGNCPFCRHWAHDLDRLFSAPPKVVSSANVDLDAWGLTDDDVSRYVWLITDKEHLAGAAAIAAICRHQPQWRWRFIGHLMDTWPVSVLAELGYRVVSKARMLLPHPKCDCELPGAPKS